MNDKSKAINNYPKKERTAKQGDRKNIETKRKNEEVRIKKKE